MSETARNLTQDAEEWYPNPKQQAALNAASTGEHKSLSAICRAAGIARNSLRKWLGNDPQFVKAWASVWLAQIDRNMPTMTAAQIKKANAGNTHAFRELTTLAGKMIQKIDLTSGGKPLPVLGIEIVRPKDGDA